MRHPRAERSRHWLDRSSGPEEMYRLEINMRSHQQDLLVFIYLFIYLFIFPLLVFRTTVS